MPRYKYRVREFINIVESAGKFLPATPENIALAKEFVMQKWRERAVERGLPEPADLTNSCKFSSLFAQKIFGGQIRGNENHQFVRSDDGQIIDLNIDAADVKKLGDLAHLHDRRWFGNRDHRDSMAFCEPRAEQWAAEFRNHVLSEDTREPWMDHGDDEPTYDEWKPEHGIDNFVRTEFTCGSCGYLALALHEVTGWPIMAVFESSSPYEEPTIEHVWVVNPQGKAVDVNGVHPTGYAKTKYDGPSSGANDVRPLDSDFVRKEMADEGALAWARPLVKNFPEHFGISPGR